jgi:hypothetical protein
VILPRLREPRCFGPFRRGLLVASTPCDDAGEAMP